MGAHEVRAMERGLEEAAIASACVLGVPARGPIEEPVVVDAAIEIRERSREAALDERVVAGEAAVRVCGHLGTRDAGRAEPRGRQKGEHTRTAQAVRREQGFLGIRRSTVRRWVSGSTEPDLEGPVRDGVHPQPHPERSDRSVTPPGAPPDLPLWAPRFQRVDPGRERAAPVVKDDDARGIAHKTGR